MGHVIVVANQKGWGGQKDHRGIKRIPNSLVTVWKRVRSLLRTGESDPSAHIAENHYRLRVWREKGSVDFR